MLWANFPLISSDALSIKDDQLYLLPLRKKHQQGCYALRVIYYELVVEVAYTKGVPKLFSGVSAEDTKE
jgi:PP-loop superfamily ATP-utilizing enzyme